MGVSWFRIWVFVGFGVQALVYAYESRLRLRFGFLYSSSVLFNQALTKRAGVVPLGCRTEQHRVSETKRLQHESGGWQPTALVQS